MTAAFPGYPSLATNRKPTKVKMRIAGSPLANQVRLVLHTAAYWLLLLVRDHIPKAQPLAVAEFKTLQMRLIKIGARIIETGKRVRVAFAAACPSAELFSGLVGSFHPAGP